MPKKIETNNYTDIENQIEKLQKTVAFNTREFTIEILVSKYLKDIDTGNNELFVPDYQREFVWDEERQSKLIESIILGLPIPLIFLTENQDGRLEIIDGSQRIRTLSAFLENELILNGLEKINLLNSLSFKDLHISRQRKFRNIPIRTIVLSTVDDEVKTDLFERINRGSDLLFAMEKRKGIYKGDFCNFIYNDCATLPLLKKLAPLSKIVEKRQELEELILRFFALSDGYPNFKTSRQGISSYLDSYMEEKQRNFTDKEKQEKLENLKAVLNFVDKNFPWGFLKSSQQSGVSRVFFETISVGVHLALKENPDTKNQNVNVLSWITSQEFKSFFVGKFKTHDPKKISDRINFVKKHILQGS